VLSTPSHLTMKEIFSAIDTMSLNLLLEHSSLQTVKIPSKALRVLLQNALTNETLAVLFTDAVDCCDCTASVIGE